MKILIGIVVIDIGIEIKIITEGLREIYILTTMKEIRKHDIYKYEILKKKPSNIEQKWDWTVRRKQQQNIHQSIPTKMEVVLGRLHSWANRGTVQKRRPFGNHQSHYLVISEIHLGY